MVRFFCKLNMTYIQHDTFITHIIVFLFSFPALLMIIAWILFTGLATIIARYFKSSFGQKMTCGSKIWFQVTIYFCNNTFSFHQGKIVDTVLLMKHLEHLFLNVARLLEFHFFFIFISIDFMHVLSVWILSMCLSMYPRVCKSQPLQTWVHQCNNYTRFHFNSIEHKTNQVLRNNFTSYIEVILSHNLNKVIEKWIHNLQFICTNFCGAYMCTHCSFVEYVQVLSIVNEPCSKIS